MTTTYSWTPQSGTQVIDSDSGEVLWSEADLSKRGPDAPIYQDQETSIQDVSSTDVQQIQSDWASAMSSGDIAGMQSAYQKMQPDYQTDIQLQQQYSEALKSGDEQKAQQSYVELTKRYGGPRGKIQAYQLVDEKGNVTATIHESAIVAGKAPTLQELSQGKLPPGIKIKETQDGVSESAKADIVLFADKTATDPQTGKQYDRKFITDNYVSAVGPTKDGYKVNWDQLRTDEANHRVQTLMENSRTDPSMTREDTISQISSTGNEYEKVALQRYLQGEGEVIKYAIDSGVNAEDAGKIVSDYGAKVAIAAIEAANMAAIEKYALENVQTFQDRAKYESFFKTPQNYVEYGGRQKIELLKSAITSTGSDFEQRYDQLMKNVTKSTGVKPSFKGGKSDFYNNVWSELNESEQEFILNAYARNEAKHEASRSALLDMVPIYGSYRVVDRHGIGSGWSVLSIVGDVALVAGPLTKLTTAGTSAVKSTGIGVVAVPLKGSKTANVWKGIRVLDRPVIGKTDGAFTVGKRSLKYPQASQIVEEYRPLTKIETNIMADPKAMAKMGFPEKEIQKVVATLENRNTFIGKKSPYLTKEVITDPIKSLKGESVDLVMRKAATSDDVTMVYGSGTIKQQAIPEAREWRSIGDIDIQTNLSDNLAKKFAQDLSEDIKKIEGPDRVKIDPSKPFLIQTRDNEGWHHAIDIHSKTDDFSSLYEEIVDYSRTGPYSYGAKVAQKTAKVEYPGIGDFEIMGLSESGIRKADTIIKWYGQKIDVPTHRVKDIVDFYVITWTYRGKAAADAWARKYGIDPKDMMKLAKELDKSKDFVKGWKFTKSKKPSPSARVRNVSPKIEIVSPSIRVASVSPASIVSPKASPKLSPSAKISPSAKVSPKVSPSVSPSAAVSPKISPEMSPMVSPSVSPKVSPDISPAVSPEVSPSVSPPSRAISSPSVPSKSPSPYAPPLPSTPPYGSPGPSPAVSPPTFTTGKESSKKGSLPIPTTDMKEHTGRIIPGTVTFRMGEVSTKGKGRKPVYWLIPPPYKKIYYMLGIPEGATESKGPKSAYSTIQTLGAKPPEELLTIDMGAMDIVIDNPNKVGKAGAIEFIPDKEGKTVSNLQTKKSLPRTKASDIRQKTYRPKPKRKKRPMDKITRYSLSFWK